LRCRFRRCPFHASCASGPTFCILLLYAVLIGVLVWIGYLFLSG